MGPDRLEGTITDSSEQLILGASNDIFLTPAQWVQIDDPARNPVIWQRVDDDWDCDRLARNATSSSRPTPSSTGSRADRCSARRGRRTPT